MINKYTHEKQIIVIGGGSWGSAIADQLQKAGNNVTVLARRQETADALSQSRVLTLPQVTLKHPLTSTTQPECLRSAELIVIAVPLSATKDTMTMVKHYTSPNAVILFTGKGLLPASHKGGIFLPEWVDTHLPSFDQFALLSGPSFADEVIADKPTAVMIASNSLPLSAKVSESEAPILMDTPLARLDTKFRRGILEKVPKYGTQFILLAQDVSASMVAQYQHQGLLGLISLSGSKNFFKPGLYSTNWGT